MINRTKENFNEIKSFVKINWQQLEYVSFKFKRRKDRSDNLGFDWGKGTLVFNSNGYQYQLIISEMSFLISGWKGIGYTLSAGKQITTTEDELEFYGKAFIEVLKKNDYDKLLSLCMFGEELVNTVNEKTEIKEIKAQVTENFSAMTSEEWQRFIKSEFKRIKEKHQLNWKKIEYLKFKFEKNEGDSRDLNFEWGKAILYFKANGQKYEFKFGEFAHLITGWKGNNFKLVLD